MTTFEALFSIGQLIHHKRFDYRGVILDVDPVFQGTEEWYALMAKSKPPKDKPWYHVLVNDGTSRTYVAEQNLEVDIVGGPIDHPEVRIWFEPFNSNGYKIRVCEN
jgi:heat shock protein HspQ